MQTVASVGDQPLPVKSGEPGSSVAADEVEPSRSGPATGRISGRVVDENGIPIPDVRVRLAVNSAPGGRVVRSTTDSTGAFTLRGVRPGSRYTVIAEREDEQGLLTGRSVVRAPDADVRISLAPAEAIAPGAINARAPRRVAPVSRRPIGDPADEPFDESQVNVEDLPPAPEAEALTAPRTARSLPRDTSARSSRWRPGGSDAPATTTEEPAEALGGSHLPPAAEPPEPASRVRTFAPSAEHPSEEDEGPNPLPPALEPGQEPVSSAKEPPRATGPEPGPTPVEPGGPLEALASSRAKEPPAGLPTDLTAPVESTAATTPSEPVDRASASLADSKPEPKAEARPSAKPADVPVFEPVPGPVAQAPPAIPDQSIFEREHPAGPEPTAEPPAGRKRPTWDELAAVHGSAPLPREAAKARTPAALPGPARSAPEPAAAARAAPPATLDDGKAYCDFDPKHRRIRDFRLPDLQGRPVRFQDLDADLVLLDFWGTWCPPCIRSIPHLVDLQQRMGNAKLRVVGIACEQGPTAGRAPKVAQEARRLGINYPVLLSAMDGPCPLQEALHVQAFPTLVLVDREGRILWQDQGATPVTLARLDRFVASAARSDTVRR